VPRPLTPPSEIIPGGGCCAYRATADLQTLAEPKAPEQQQLVGRSTYKADMFFVFPKQGEKHKNTRKKTQQKHTKTHKNTTLCAMGN